MSATPRAQNGKAGDGIGDDSGLAGSLLAGGQNDASRLDIGIERIARTDSQSATNRTRKDNLTLG